MPPASPCASLPLPALTSPVQHARMLQHRTSIKVRYAETDMMGVVYHGAYLPWLEVARTEMLEANGIPYRELEEAGFFLPVIEVNMRYLRPAKYPDTVEIVAVIREKPILRIRIDYELHRGAEKLAAGHTMHAFIDKSGHPVRPPAGFADLMASRFA